MADINNLRFGRLTVLSFDRKEKCGQKSYHNFWNCKCDCGNVLSAREDALKYGKTLSCGCLGRENRIKACLKHGKSNTRLYHIWVGMKGRCHNPNNVAYKNYGARGINICDCWNNNFNAFYEWALKSGYNATLTIDRILNYEDYSPENCQWITIQEQQAVGKKRLSSRYRLIEYRGEKFSLSGWSKRLGSNRAIVWDRLHKPFKGETKLRWIV